MNNEEEKRCPLCAEEMDWTDQQLNACKCGYEVCVWCWHHIMDMAEKDATEGRCPACRTPYDKDRIVGLESNFQRVTTHSSNRKQKVSKTKPKPKPEVRKDLSSVRVIQRRMAYIIGLPLDLADEDLLYRKDHFGKYGKVTKVSLSRTAGGALQQFTNDTCSVYITFSKEEEAVTCIQSVHGYVLDGRLLRASFGTAKYCHAWLRNMPCNNPGCLYLHNIGAEEDSFGKDEVAAVHTRNRVQEIVGGTKYPHRRSGTRLPPPVIDQSHNPKVISPEPIISPKNTSTFVEIVNQESTNTSPNKKELQLNETEEEEVEEDKSDSYVNEIEQEEEEQEEDEEEEGELEEEEELKVNDGFQDLAKSDRIYRGSNSFSNEEIVEHLRRLDVNNDDEMNADVENSIISDILTLDLDGCDDSVAGLFEARDGRHHSDHSRFSFANQYNDIGSRAQKLTPPGFPVTKPPPGFACMRTDQAVAASSGKPLTNGLTNSWPSSYSSTSLDDDRTKYWQHFMLPQQHSAPPPAIQQQPPPHPIIPHLFPSPPQNNFFGGGGGGGGGGGPQHQYPQPKFGNYHHHHHQQEESFLPNYGTEYMFQMPNSGDVYTPRVFGM